MSLLVVGSVGLDDVETPRAQRRGLLGGSAVYFSVAASFFTRVHLVGVVGQDFPAAHRELLAARGIDLSGLEAAQGATFRWSGRYRENMVDRDTLKTELNVFATFDPKIPPAARRVEYLFLANGVPAVQRQTLARMERRPKFVAADTMDLWIRTARPELDRLFGEVDALILNDSEARLMTGEHELLRAGRAIRKLGPRVVIIKKGEHGALLVSADEPFALPAFPLEEVVDPTGAGDSFAGGLLGCLASAADTSPAALRRALAYGTVVASFTCQDFSLDRLLRTTREDIEARYRELKEIVRIPD
jgi:sugar/nucleoside kinase (ribokinase family)